MAGRGTSERSSLLLSYSKEQPTLEERSMEETAKSRLIDPCYLTSFDETGKVVSKLG